jgi:hypothetical protein
MPTPAKTLRDSGPAEPDQEPIMPKTVQGIAGNPKDMPKQIYNPLPDKAASRSKPRFDGRSW